MAKDYMEGAGAPVAGASRDLQELTVQELMAFAPSSARPEWMKTRYPVAMEEYYRLIEEARQPSPADAGPAARDATTEDMDNETALAELEAPEGEVVSAGPIMAAPGAAISFDGIPQTAFMPPDNTIAVGPNHVLVSVNSDLAGYSKTGSLQFRWVNMVNLFSGVLPAQASIFDPKLAYDHYAQRWIVVAAARRASPAGSWIMLAVSQGANPAGPYWVWALDAALDGSTATSNWADYPMLGFDTQAIYISLNMFQIGGGFQYAKLRILNKSELYAGGVGAGHSIRWYDFWSLRNPDNSVAFTVQPAVHFRGTGGNPSGYLINALWPSASTLTLWVVGNPIGFWSGSAPTLAKTSVDCRAYELPPQAVQQGSDTRIATNDIRLLNAVYQNTGGTQRLWTCHTSKHTWPQDTEARSVVQWYEIDVPSSKVIQQNRYGAAKKYYFFPAIQTDINRNAVLVFGRSGADEFAQLRQTGRKNTDPLNDLQNSALVKAGMASYTGGRWGDYFGIARDGGDANVVWMYGEYANTGNTWGTRVCAVRF